MNPIAAALVSGTVGWAAENALYGHDQGRVRENAYLKGLPFLPVYAAGGGALALMTPALRKQPWPVRGLAYAGALTAIEAGAGALDKQAGRQSWDYGGGSRVDLTHAALWGALGLLVEPLLR